MDKDNRFDNTDELDIEIARSVEKLIDEETSVAKAFVDRDMPQHVQDQEDILGKTQVIPSIDDIDVPTELFRQPGNQQSSSSRQTRSQQPGSQQSRGSSRAEDPYARNASRPGGSSGQISKSGNNKKKNDNRMMIIIIAAVVVAAVGILIAVSLLLNNRKMDSYDYNYSTGLGFYNSRNYTEALQYWEKAASDSEGRKNVDLKIKMYECYAAVGNKDRAAEMLKDALSYDKYNEKTLVMLAKYYTDNKDGAALTELLRKYRGTDGEKYLKTFEVAMPSASEASGKFDRALEVTLESVNSYKIYYTVDGSAVTSGSQEYTEPVKIEKGKTTLKAVTVDANGTMSYELELVFEIDYKNPDAPAITPATGTYPAGTTIEITNIPEGGKAYYTLDGKMPTKESEEYSGPISMPENNIVFSAIIIDVNNLESTVTKRNYDVKITPKYSFDEAIEKLKAAMIAKEDLNRDGTSADGGEAKFTYYKKTTINDIEMYLTFYDIIKNKVTTRQTYYFGIDAVTGKCYKVTEQGGTFTAVAY